MLSAALPRQRNTAGVNLGLTVEALSFSLLAYYASGSVPARVLTSFQRAWGVTSITYRPRVPGGRPGYLIAYFDGANERKCIVAIEGTTDVSQYMPLHSAIRAVTPTGQQGKVYDVFNNHAATIYTELLADTTFAPFTLDKDTMTVWTGHSLGAALAEILAMRMHTRYTMGFIRLIKFASPRVGDSTWLEGFNRRIYRESNYCGFDPVDVIPPAVPSVADRTWMGAELPLVLFQRDTSSNRIGMDGSNFERPSVLDRRPWQQIVRAHTTATSLVSEWWGYHSLQAYRVAYSNLLSTHRDDIWYRFQYCDYPNSTNYGQRWVAGRTAYNAAYESFDASQADYVIVGRPSPAVVAVTATPMPAPLQSTTVAPPPPPERLEPLGRRTSVSVVNTRGR